MSDDSTTDPVGSEEIFDDESTVEEESLLAVVLCDRLDAFVIIFSLSMLFFVFAVISVLGTTPGTATDVIAVMNVVGASVLGVISLTAIVLCRVLGS